MTFRIALIALLGVLMMPLTACNPVDPEQELAQRQQARAEAEAEKQYANFQQLVATGRADLALNIADHVLKTYPNSAAAAKFRTAVEPLRAQVAGERETRRLQGLWVYHDDTDAEAGGRVRSAYIFAQEPLGPAEAGKEAPRARLVLRRHPQWGDDVYLLSERGPFTCASPCQLTVQFDAAEPRSVEGEIPETGEHAIFVKDFDYFASHLQGSAKLRISAELKDGGPQTMAFEVGGYDPTTISGD